MIQKEYPILEFDEDKNAFIRPKNTIKSVENIPGTCVLSFYSEANKNILMEYPHRIISNFITECINFPLYELDLNGIKIGFIQAAVSSPLAAAQIDELVVKGFKKFIVCGSCGVLQKELAVGHLIIPIAAVRDEGTSYHYVKPSREILANERIVKIIENELALKKIPYIKGKTWTTDAIYRETSEKIALRKKEGCITVEMETSAYIAVTQYNNVEFGQILYSGDSLAGEKWDNRNFLKRTDIRDFTLRQTLDISTKL